MRIRVTVGRLVALPLKHKLIAAGIAVGVTACYLIWARHLPPQEYTSSALLFFDQTAAPKSDSGRVQAGQTQAPELAKSILNDDLIAAICKHFGLFPDSSGQKVTRFRSNLMLSRESTSSLRVTWRGADRRQTIAVANTVAVLLTSWVHDAAYPISDPVQPLSSSPSLPITATTPIEPQTSVETVQAEPSVVKARRDTGRNKKEELKSSLTAADHKLAVLGDEARRLEASIGEANLKSQASLSARQPLTEELATEKRKLDQLRARYTDAYPDVEAAQERITETEQKLAAIPVVRPAPDAYPSRLNTIKMEMNRVGAEKLRLSRELSKKARLETSRDHQEVKSTMPMSRLGRVSGEPQQGQSKPQLSGPVPSRAKTDSNPQAPGPTDGDQVRAFRILARAANAEPINNPRRLQIRLAALSGPLCGVLYLLLAVWWFRAVRNVETLERIMPEKIAYLGAIPRMNTWPHST
jgi:hypothetical protein